MERTDAVDTAMVALAGVGSSPRMLKFTSAGQTDGLASDVTTKVTVMLNGEPVWPGILTVIWPVFIPCGKPAPLAVAIVPSTVIQGVAVVIVVLEVNRY